MSHHVHGEGAIALERSRFLDYVALTKPELTFLSVLTALAGFFLGSDWQLQGSLLLHTLVGTGLVGGGAGALNQYLERRYDAMMKRTEHRPLPSGRLSPAEALVFGMTSAAVGLLELTFFVNPLTGLLGLATFSTYVFIYTPMKRVAPVATLIGAIPGALPPVMGWVAVRKDLPVEIWLLFAILFFWQMPHFLSLAWMYRSDYAGAGYRLLTTFDATGRKTSRQILGYTIILLPLTLLPGIVGEINPVYLAVTFVLNAAFIWLARQLVITKSTGSARHVFLGSLIYLPLLLVFLVLTTG